MIILALDTCLHACAGAVVRDGAVLSKIVEPMQRGHQERIALMTSELMAAANLTFSDLDRVAVTVGPGSFTGLRIGLAFAKGLGVALDIPCVGVGVLDALGRQAVGRVLAALDARGGAATIPGRAGRLTPWCCGSTLTARRGEPMLPAVAVETAGLGSH